ncbi:MAG: hypothetical protein GTO45_33260 [Candidatus Aminicenantes bacterium]|nr:hypothetical protein [Candidatus Aminicenantes bacterium]
MSSTFKIHRQSMPLVSDILIIHSEKELNKGYADLVLEPFLARYEGIKYSYLP